MRYVIVVNDFFFSALNTLNKQCQVTIDFFFFSVNKKQPAPGPYDHSVDDREHTVDQWKDLIYKEVMEYEAAHATPNFNPNIRQVN